MKKKKVFFLLYLPWILCFHLFSSLFVSWLVRQKDYTKISKQIALKLTWRMGLSKESTPLHVGADPDKGD